jgi:hypothetical protein
VKERIVARSLSPDIGEGDDYWALTRGGTVRWT